jgi:hypothetical protein
MLLCGSALTQVIITAAMMIHLYKNSPKQLASASHSRSWAIN